ncbi:MAG: hypothetical protein HYV07_10500 [Deltaproteobacteria bacterium]|nr:hypothetical protein [Deltaproteobacteria bacterium]
MSKQRVIEVVADWVGLEGPTLLGHLTATPARGKEVFAFEYDKEWLSTASRQQLDPSMALHGGDDHQRVTSVARMDDRLVVHATVRSTSSSAAWRRLG